MLKIKSRQKSPALCSSAGRFYDGGAAALGGRGGASKINPPPCGVQTLLAVTPAASETSLLRAEAERIRLMERCRLGGDGEGEGDGGEAVWKRQEKEGGKSTLRAAKGEASLKMERGEMTRLIMKV